ncbi:hypothetical protein [Curtobacterium sp. MCBA15_004]|uniref:hypothetical protein n=1 Tax=Curtobacterium sp. MCBA15_004 TaxID=1898733 RepID=UPI001587C833|nr:hypothetical protein [Curtobacterium sp. MCBA15_004]WIA95829.1 hypothetical protein QOL16_11990 [Curtobacterium sp. MCBA15_004]
MPFEPLQTIIDRVENAIETRTDTVTPPFSSQPPSRCASTTCSDSSSGCCLASGMCFMELYCLAGRTGVDGVKLVSVLSQVLERVALVELSSTFSAAQVVPAWATTVHAAIWGDD